MTDTTHACPPDGSGLMPCCGRTPLEVPRTDRMTEDAAGVTCAARTDLAEPDDPSAYALARHIADHPMSTVQAAFRYLNAPLSFELHDDGLPDAPTELGASAANANETTGSVGTFAEHGPDSHPITGYRTWDDVKDHQFTGLGDIVDVACARLDCPEPDAASTVLEGEDHAYRDAVNAPLRPETIAALKARFASGGLLPTRTLKSSARTTPDNPPTTGHAADDSAPAAHACGCSDPACDDAPCRYCKTCLDPKEPTP